MPFFISKALSIAFSIFLSQNKPNKHPLACFAQHSTWNKCTINCGYYFNFITWNFHQGCYKTLPLGGHCPRCSITHIPQQNHWKENILPMELYNIAQCNIYNDHPDEETWEMADQMRAMYPSLFVGWGKEVLGWCWSMFGTCFGDIFIYVLMWWMDVCPYVYGGKYHHDICYKAPIRCMVSYHLSFHVVMM